MIVRFLRASDLPALEKIAGTTGFPYVSPFSKTVECTLVVADDDGKILGAVAAERIVQLFGWFDPELHPAAKFAVMKLLHEPVARELAAKGYTEANAFLPPGLEKPFGNRLRRVGWVKNWTSWCIKW